MSDPFTLIKAINKKTEIEDVDGYVPYIVNHSFSAFPDTVLLANEMNRFPDLPHQMQFDFYYYAVRKGNRFEKWLKKNENDTLDNVQMIMNRYGYSQRKAREALDILRPDQLEYICKSMERGGR